MVSLSHGWEFELVKFDWLFNENFTLISEESSFQVEKMIKDRTNHGHFLTYFNQTKPFKNMKLSAQALLVCNTPNAGGSSVESETLSFEMFKSLYNATLLKTEMQVAYFPEGGSITDYVIRMFDQEIGVSVTRAMKFDSSEFTLEDANVLLKKKLRGVQQSTRNSLFKWDKQILHVWLFDRNVIHTLLCAWQKLEAELKHNTVMVMTLARNSPEVFTNQERKTKRKKAKSM